MHEFWQYLNLCHQYEGLMLPGTACLYTALLFPRCVLLSDELQSNTVSVTFYNIDISEVRITLLSHATILLETVMNNIQNRFLIWKLCNWSRPDMQVTECLKVLILFAIYY